MLNLLQNVFVPKSFFEGSPLERRRSMLTHKLFLAGLCSLIFYFVYHPDYDHTANLIGTAGYWGLLALLFLGASYGWVANATFLWSILFISYLAALTGGINSPAMVWMTVFHFCFDLQQAGYLHTNFYANPFWTVQRTAIVSLFLFVAGLSLAVALALGPVVFWAAVFGMAMAWAYSAPPFRFKGNGWWGNAACGLCYEGLAWVTGAVVMAGGLPDSRSLLLAGLYSLGAHGIMTLNDFKSIEGDTRFGLRSLPVILGAEMAAKVACIFMALPQAVVGAPWGKRRLKSLAPAVDSDCSEPSAFCGLAPLPDKNATTLDRPFTTAATAAVVPVASDKGSSAWWTARPAGPTASRPPAPRSAPATTPHPEPGQKRRPMRGLPDAAPQIRSPS